MNTLSSITAAGAVAFPQFLGERVYMQKILDGRMPHSLARWQPAIDAMLSGIKAREAYVMIDQKRVLAGDTQRRGGVHIDGDWVPAKHCHGTRWDNGPSWSHTGGQTMILASDVCASQAYVGRLPGDPGEGGDCSHLSMEGLLAAPLEAGRIYVGNGMTLHESLPVAEDCNRTLVRIHIVE